MVSVALLKPNVCFLRLNTFVLASPKCTHQPRIVFSGFLLLKVKLNRFLSSLIQEVHVARSQVLRTNWYRWIQFSILRHDVPGTYDAQDFILTPKEQAWIQDFGQGGQQSFDPKGALSPTFAHNRGFPLKMPQRCMIIKNLGGQGGPPGSTSEEPGETNL